jgi:TolB-like protein
MSLRAFYAFCYEKKTTIAVWDLEDLTPGDSTYADFGQPLAATIIETLKETTDYTVVERDRLILALKELNLGTSSMVEESARLEIGKILQAHTMAFGGYQVIGSIVRLDLRFVDVETGKILKAGQKTTWDGNLSGWLEAVKEFVAEIVQ